MSNFLRVFEAKALAAALTDAGHSVSERTVQRWKSGATKPKPQDIQAIHRIIRMDTEKPTPDEPEWATEMERRLTDLLMTNRTVFVETMATYFARLGVETALDDPPPNEPDPETPGAATKPVEPQ